MLIDQQWTCGHTLKREINNRSKINKIHIFSTSSLLLSRCLSLGLLVSQSLSLSLSASLFRSLSLFLSLSHPEISCREKERERESDYEGGAEAGGAAQCFRVL